ncbi:MAG: OmpH family outer membrane protein [Holosporaceae bacterium]|nr:OmpH family outer membrane protein [Holosporaceae bacterium]
MRERWKSLQRGIILCLTVLLWHEQSYGKGNRSEGKELRVAVLNVERLQNETEAGKSVKDQAEHQNGEAREQMEKHENQIKAMEKNVKNNSDSAEDARKIEEAILALYDMVRKAKYRIAVAYEQAMEEFSVKLKKAVKEVCDENKITIVLNHDAVFYSDEGCVDITEEVKRVMNKRCKYIPVKLSEQKNDK